jgi:large subunit ribosomal protein L30
LPSRKPRKKGAADRGRAARTEGTGGGGVGPRLRVTLTKSLIGLVPNHVRTLHALGLRKIRASVRHEDTPAIRGMLARVAYAVSVEEAEQA